VTSKGLPDNVLNLLNPERRLKLPASSSFWPAPIYLDYHRREIFKG
jgi:hypothetical protein